MRENRYLLRGFALLLAAGICAWAPVASADPVLNAANGHYYELIIRDNQAPISWTTASNAAAGMTWMGASGYLATVTSAAEESFIMGLTGFMAGGGGPGTAFKPFRFGASFGSTGPWIGGRFNTATNEWEWKTNDEGPFAEANGDAIGGAYTNWPTHEPNNGGPGTKQSGSNEPALGYFYTKIDTPNAFIWADYHEFRFDVFSYVVEYSPVPEPTGLALIGLALGAGVLLRRRKG